MSTATLILGESGAGKSTSLRNLDPAQTLLIQAVRKPLPFKGKGWAYFSKDACPTGNVFVSDQYTAILKMMEKTRRKVVILDDAQYVLANEFMRRSDETGFSKFTEIGRHAWEIFMLANNLADDVRVYILSHTETGDGGQTKIKTIGRMLDEKITIEGLFSIVLRARVIDGEHFFQTRNSGSDTVKSPMGLFDADRINNDLALVDNAICDYYEINQPA